MPDLLALRTAAGLDRTAAATLLGVNASTLWRWESGKCWPGRHTLAHVVATYERTRLQPILEELAGIEASILAGQALPTGAAERRKVLLGELPGDTNAEVDRLYEAMRRGRES